MTVNQQQQWTSMASHSGVCYPVTDSPSTSFARGKPAQEAHVTSEYLMQDLVGGWAQHQHTVMIGIKYVDRCEAWFTSPDAMRSPF